MSRHANYCLYPSEPCSCYVDNEHRRRTYHKNYCFYPNEPCCCDLDGAEKGEHD